MGEKDEKKQGPKAPAFPAWQPSQPLSADNNTESTTGPTGLKDGERLGHARRFLQEEGVRQASRQKKVEFLKSKGLRDFDIETLLNEDKHEYPLPKTQDDKETGNKESSMSPPADQHEDDPAKNGHPPIVTYPEFLTGRARPPPLVTATGFLNTAYAFTCLSTLVYGGSRYALAPMVESLTESRAQLHDAALKDISRLVEKLQDTVSEIPPTISAPSSHTNNNSNNKPGSVPGATDDTASSCGDPTEVFHRDVGVQTAPEQVHPSSPSRSPQHPSVADSKAAPPSEQQTRRISQLVGELKVLNRGLISESEDQSDLKTELDVFKDDLHHLTYPPSANFVGSYSLYGSGANGNEPDDEVKRVKENIRRVKGVLLSARSFPAALTPR